MPQRELSGQAVIIMGSVTTMDPLWTHYGAGKKPLYFNVVTT